MSVLAGDLVFPRVALSESGVSESALMVDALRNAAIYHLEQSIALFGPKSRLISQVRELGRECAEAGWDGDRAKPISPEAEDQAIAFIRALPADYPLPELCPETDGDVELDWMDSRHRVLSVSVGSGIRLPYAWIDGTDGGHGVARFDGRSVPPRLLQAIRLITDQQ